MSTCPFSLHSLDENNARLQALFVIFASVALFMTYSWIFALIMCGDFILKSIDPKLSVLSFCGKKVLQFFDIPPKKTNAGPKIFAAKIGATLMALICVSILFHLFTLVTILLGILFVCAFLEAVFSFCLGCVLYTFMIKHLPPPDYTI